MFQFFKENTTTTHKVYRTKPSIGDWFSLTSDEDEEDDNEGGNEGGQVQNSKTRRKVTEFAHTKLNFSTESQNVH